MLKTVMNIASKIEHTLLAPDATEERIRTLCNEAMQYHFRSVCVNTCWVPLCAELLRGTGVAVGCVVGFPLGAMSKPAKKVETAAAIAVGADEVDMVINIGYLKDGHDGEVAGEIALVKRACGDKVLKVILETCLLTQEEKIRACRIAVEAGADYVKTSTGFSKGGATVEDVALMRRTVDEYCASNGLDGVKVKASGGIRDYKTALAMLEAGADTLGCSAGVAIVEGAFRAECARESGSPCGESR